VVKKLGQNKERVTEFPPPKLDLTFRTPNQCAKFHKNRTKTAAIGAQAYIEIQVIL